MSSVARSRGGDALIALLAAPPAAEHEGVLDYVSPGDDYCDNFGAQWNDFRRVQLDSESGTRESHDRFYSETGWGQEDLTGKVLLDAGCGAGRFAEVALEAGARVIAVDISEAAYACAETLRRFPSSEYLVLRADISRLPCRQAMFDGIYSLGVLQHTPEPLLALERLVRYLKPGGRLAVWIYERQTPDIRPLLPRTWIRRLVSRWPTRRKLLLSKTLVGVFFPAGWAFSWFGRWGERATVFLPYAARHTRARGDLCRQWSYSVMDTLDWYGPVYDQPQRAEDVLAAMKVAGLTRVRRLPARGMAIIGERPLSPAASAAGRIGTE